MTTGQIIAGVLLFAAVTAVLYVWGLKKSLGQQEDLTRALLSACGSRVLKYLKTLTAQDPQYPRIVDMTPLGLVEITRKKSHPTLAEQWEKI